MRLIWKKEYKIGAVIVGKFYLDFYRTKVGFNLFPMIFYGALSFMQLYNGYYWRIGKLGGHIGFVCKEDDEQKEDKMKSDEEKVIKKLMKEGSIYKIKHADEGDLFTTDFKRFIYCTVYKFWYGFEGVEKVTSEDYYEPIPFDTQADAIDWMIGKESQAEKEPPSIESRLASIEHKLDDLEERFSMHEYWQECREENR